MENNVDSLNPTSLKRRGFLGSATAVEPERYIHHLLESRCFLVQHKIREFGLKLPSLASVVTPKNIWETSICIANFGEVFTDEELASIGTPINEKNLFRLLSYMKYLGLLEEKRERIITDGKRESIQKWYQSKEKAAQDFFYYLVDNRYEEARKIFIKLIEKHDIFQALKKDLFNNRVVTEVDLRVYFRRKIPHKSANYYRGGTIFIIKLFLFCDLIIKENNKLILSNNVSSHNLENVERTEKDFSDEKKQSNLIESKKSSSELKNKPDFKKGDIEIYMEKNEKNLEVLRKMIPIIEFEIKKKTDKKKHLNKT